MRFYKILALGGLTVGVFTIGSCAIPQAPVECNTATPMFAFYTLESGDPNSECGAYGGDVIQSQRYLAPKSDDARLAVLPGLGAQTTLDGRDTPDDEDLAHESAIGHFKTLNPDDKGICELVNVSDGYETYAEIPADPGDPDAGIDPTPEVPELSIRHAWEGVRVLSSAQLPGTLMDGHVTITQDTCTAKYKMYAVYPIVPCQVDDDCNPEAEPDKGRVTGSGMNPVYKPYCRHLAAGTQAPFAEVSIGAPLADTGDPENPAYGICFPADDQTIDVLMNLK